MAPLHLLPLADVTNSSPVASTSALAPSAKASSTSSVSAKRPRLRQTSLSFGQKVERAPSSDGSCYGLETSSPGRCLSSERGSSPFAPGGPAHALAGWCERDEYLRSDFTSPAPEAGEDKDDALPPSSPTIRYCAEADFMQVDDEEDEEEDDSEAEANQGSVEDTHPHQHKRQRTSTHQPALPLFAHNLVLSSPGSSTSPPAPDSFTPHTGPRRLSPLFAAPSCRPSLFATHSHRALGLTTPSRHLPARAFLRDFTSSNESQVFRCPSLRDDRSFAPPFALTFSHAAKRGGKQLFAVGCEEGRVSYIDACASSQDDAETSRTSFQAHANAIFDVRWSADDSLVGTASGDQTVRLFDSETGVCTSVLSGHTCTVKSFAFNPTNKALLSTASRDGSIRVWDTRLQGAHLAPAVDPAGPSPPSSAGCVNMIRNAHGTVGGRKPKGRGPTKSVTGVTYLAHDTNLLASSGSSDSVVKVWDLRKSHQRRVNPVDFDSNAAVVAERLASSGTRQHGIASLSLAPNGRNLYALSTDSQIHALSSAHLASPLHHDTKTFSHPSLSCGSFYVRLAVSPCSRYLTSGSSDGGLFMWDAEGSGREGVRMVGHDKEVSGLDWGRDTVATCADDLLVRVWDARNVGVARAARADQGLRNRWAGAEE